MLKSFCTYFLGNCPPFYLLGDYMQCRECSGKLEVHRMCRRVRMRCTECKKEYQIHEVASDLDQETEDILSRYTSIVYD